MPYPEKPQHPHQWAIIGCNEVSLAKHGPQCWVSMGFNQHLRICNAHWLTRPFLSPFQYHVNQVVQRKCSERRSDDLNLGKRKCRQGQNSSKFSGAQNESKLQVAQSGDPSLDRRCLCDLPSGNIFFVIDMHWFSRMHLPPRGQNNSYQAVQDIELKSSPSPNI